MADLHVASTASINNSGGPERELCDRLNSSRGNNVISSDHKMSIKLIIYYPCQNLAQSERMRDTCQEDIYTAHHT